MLIGAYAYCSVRRLAPNNNYIILYNMLVLKDAYINLKKNAK